MMAAESWRDFIPPAVGDISLEQWVALDLAHVEANGQWPWERLCAEVEKLQIVRHMEPEQTAFWSAE